MDTELVGYLNGVAGKSVHRGASSSKYLDFHFTAKLLYVVFLSKFVTN